MTAILAGTATLSAVVALAEDSRDGAIRSVITDQMRAFQSGTPAQAFSFASPAIKSLFGDPARFVQMVRDGYPMVWEPADVTFLALSDRNGRHVQRVMIRDQAGRVHLLDYDMIESFSGWRINGVQLVQAQGTA